MCNRFMPRTLMASVATAATLAIGPVAPAYAANNIQDVGASERVNFSGKLRMLSQRVAAAACNLDAQVMPEVSRSILEGAAAELNAILDALESGNPDLNVNGAETRRKTLVAIGELRGSWAPLKTAVGQLLEAPDNHDAAGAIAEGNMPLLGKAKLLVAEISGQYSDPTAMLQADAILVDIAGRQRMLTQKMSKESCLIWSGSAGDGGSDALAGTMQMFEISLLALRDGLSAAGVKPAPTEEIFAGLDALHTDWQALKPALQGAVDDNDADPEIRAEVFATLNTMLKEMNDVVTLYTDYAKTGL